MASIRRTSWWKPAWSVVVTAIVAHLALIPVGFYLHNSDFAVFSLFSEGRDLSESSLFFYYQQPYGGTALSLIRSLWNLPFSWFGIPFPLPHFIFLYSVLPACMALLTFFLVRAWTDQKTGWLIGMITAVGFQYWVHLFGNDFYWAYLICGMLLMTWRASLHNPLWELSRFQLFVCGCLCGGSIYLSRVSLIFVVAFLLPWESIRRTAARLLAPKDRRDKAAQITFWTLITLFLSLSIFGETIGSIKLHAAPNFRLAVLVFVFLFLKVHWQHLNRHFLQRLSPWMIGLICGATPEIAYRLQYGFPRGSGMEFASFGEVLKLMIGKFPLAFQELATGYSHLSHYLGWNQIFTIVLLASALVVSFIGATQKNFRYGPILIGISLSLTCYFMVKTYDHGPSRYLFPIMPFLLVGAGILIQRFPRPALALLLLSATYQIQERVDSIRHYAQTDEIRYGNRVISEFRKQKMNSVITDHYWNSTNLSVLSQGSPFFVPDGRKWGPESEFRRAEAANLVGILLRKKGQRQAELRGQTYDLQTIGSYGKYHLYEGVRKVD